MHFFIVKENKKKNQKKTALREVHRLVIYDFPFTYVATTSKQHNLVYIYYHLKNLTGKSDCVIFLATV